MLVFFFLIIKLIVPIEIAYPILTELFDNFFKILKVYGHTGHVEECSNVQAFGC